MTNRPEPRNCQHEPPYPDHDTELFLFRYPDENFNESKNSMSDCDQSKMDNLPTREEYEREKRYPYRQKCREVKHRFEEDSITRNEALKKLQEIEKTAYEEIPNAEPDGDITYCVATIAGEILTTSPK